MGPVLRVVCCFGRSFGPGQLVCGGALGGVGAEMFGAQRGLGGAVFVPDTFTSYFYGARPCWCRPAELLCGSALGS